MPAISTGADSGLSHVFPALQSGPVPDLDPVQGFPLPLTFIPCTPIRSMDRTQELLQAETLKWLKKLEARPLSPVRQSKPVKEQITNIRAYCKDSRHFLEKKDFLRAFEAAIYAWGIAETLERLGLLQLKGR